MEKDKRKTRERERTEEICCDDGERWTRRLMRESGAL